MSQTHLKLSKPAHSACCYSCAPEHKEYFNYFFIRVLLPIQPQSGESYFWLLLFPDLTDHRKPSLLYTFLFTPSFTSDLLHHGLRCFLLSGWLSAFNSICYSAVPLPFFKWIQCVFCFQLSKAFKNLHEIAQVKSLSPTYTPHLLYIILTTVPLLLQPLLLLLCLYWCFSNLEDYFLKVSNLLY